MADDSKLLVDGEELTRAEALDRRAKRRAEAAQNPPTVVVENLHVHYKVYGAATKGAATGALNRMIHRRKHNALSDVHALKGISFVARRGESIGLIGSNGSGKSTLLRAIAAGYHNAMFMPGYAWLWAVIWAGVVGVGGYLYFWQGEETYGRG